MYTSAPIVIIKVIEMTHTSEEYVSRQEAVLSFEVQRCKLLLIMDKAFRITPNVISTTFFCYIHTMHLTPGQEAP